MDWNTSWQGEKFEATKSKTNNNTDSTVGNKSKEAEKQ